MIILRDFLIDQCQKRNLSWRQASLQAGLDHNAISRFVNGARPSRQSTEKLAHFFGVALPQMLALVGYMIPPESFTPQTELEWLLLEKFRSLSPEQQLYELSHLDLLLQHPTTPPPRIIGDEEAEKSEEERNERGFE